MNRLVQVAAVLLCLVPAPAGWAGGSGVTISDPWIREAPPNARTLAGYLVIRNDSGKPRTLVGAVSADFGRVMIHQTIVQGETAKMVHRDRIELPGGVTLTFEPGGYHLMLMNPKRALKAGDHSTIELVFSDGNTTAVGFEVRQSMGMKMDHSKH